MDEGAEQNAPVEENKGVGTRFQRNNIAEPAVAADGAGRTAFRGMTSFQPAPLLNLVVRPPGVLPMDDADLHKALAAFLGAFEEVFGRDWEYSKVMLSPANIASFVAPGGTFLNGGVEDEEEDWGARAELLERYRQLLQIMDRHGIQPKKP
jgi:hypothetical protein